MKHTRLMKQICIFVLCITSVFALVSCGAELDVGNNRELGEQFLTFIINDDYNSAYDMIKATVNSKDFKNYWLSIQPIVKDAGSYELKQIGWNMNASGGLTTYTTTYKVYFDNGVIVLFGVVTGGDIEGIAGIHFSDITEFTARTDSYVPVANTILIVISVLAIGFSVWMFIDCLRRKIKVKALWAILTFIGVTFTVTAGEQVGLRFMIGLVISTSSIAADPSTMSVVTKIFLPIGAIVYFFLRNKLTVKNEASADLNGDALSIVEGETAEISSSIEDVNDSAEQ